MPGHRYVIGVDIGLKNDRTVACVCHAQPVRRMVDVPARPGYDDATTREETVGVEVFLDRMQVWEGTREAPVRLQQVEEWVVQARDIFRTVEVVLDPWQAAGTMQRLRGRGLRVDEFAFSSQSVGRLAATLSTLLRDRALRLPDDPDLLDELANVRLRETSPGVLRMDHDPDQHDDRAISLALACQRLLARVSYDQGVTIGRSLYD